MGAITLQYGELSDVVIGIARHRTGTITLNSHCVSLNNSRYYISMLEDALSKGYDCILSLEGSDVVRKMMVDM